MKSRTITCSRRKIYPQQQLLVARVRPEAVKNRVCPQQKQGAKTILITLREPLKCLLALTKPCVDYGQIISRDLFTLVQVSQPLKCPDCLSLISRDRIQMSEHDYRFVTIRFKLHRPLICGERLVVHFLLLVSSCQE